jgi:SAM-dependent methyltransferase
MDVPAGRVLDAGSGITFFPFLVACAGHEVTCCDSDEGLGLGDRFAAAAGATGLPVAFRSAVLTDLPFPDGHFDAITCLSVLEHVPPDMYPAIVDSMAAVLRPGGRLVLTMDVSLRRDSQMLMEDLAALLALMAPAFELSFPLDLRRPSSLLTSDSCLTAASSWRLPWPWRPRPGQFPRAVDHADGHPYFRSIAVVGMTGRRREGKQ